VYAELCDIVDEGLLLLKERDEAMPPPTSGQGFVEQLAKIA
jgi:hypothetical protein